MTLEPQPVTEVIYGHKNREQGGPDQHVEMPAHFDGFRYRLTADGFTDRVLNKGSKCILSRLLKIVSLQDEQSDEHIFCPGIYYRYLFFFV